MPPPKVANEAPLLGQIERDAFVVVIREAAREAHRVLRERQQAVLLRRDRETRGGMRVDDATDVVTRAVNRAVDHESCRVDAEPGGIVDDRAVERDGHEIRRRDLLEHEAVRIDQEPRRASWHAGGDVRVDEVGHPVMRDQPVAGGELDARSPLRCYSSLLFAALGSSHFFQSCRITRSATGGLRDRATCR